jgi:hypothetical protein
VLALDNWECLYGDLVRLTDTTHRLPNLRGSVEWHFPFLVESLRTNHRHHSLTKVQMRSYNEASHIKPPHVATEQPKAR